MVPGLEWPTGADAVSIELTGFTGKVAVVTGAGRMRGIGRTTAVALARAGCDVVVTGTGRAPELRPQEEQQAGWRDIESVADEIRGLGRRALPVVSDVANPAEVDALLERALRELGRVDFLVNNASTVRRSSPTAVVDTEVDEWSRIVSINLNGTFLMSRAFGRQLVRQGEGGAVVSISSTAGKCFPARAASYAASKAGVQAMTASMAREVGAHGIRVNAICPGYIDTQRLERNVPRGPGREALIAERIPLGRIGTCNDIAMMVAFLCSDQGSWVTGQSINVDGGMVMER